MNDMMKTYGTTDHKEAMNALSVKLKQCRAGLARMTIRQGDLRRGITM